MILLFQDALKKNNITLIISSKSTQTDKRQIAANSVDNCTQTSMDTYLKKSWFGRKANKLN